MTHTHPIPVQGRLAAAALTLCLSAGCGAEPAAEAGAGEAGLASERSGAVVSGEADALPGLLRRATALADSVEDLLRPVPLMRPGEEAALRRYSNAENVEVARRLGARPSDSAELASLVAEGRLVRLEDSTRHWVIRELGASRPYVTSDTRSLLEELAEAFQEELTGRGLPAYRFEISSVLRTPESQAALRRSNPNATAGTSAHEFGTTVDIAYSGYAAPASLPAGLVTGEAEREALEAVARVVLERVAARKSRELKAILGGVMEAAQARGTVLVTLERQQPVYHITVAEARR